MGLILIGAGVTAGFLFNDRSVESDRRVTDSALDRFKNSLETRDLADVVGALEAGLSSAVDDVAYLCRHDPLAAIELLKRVGPSHFRGEWLELLGKSHPEEAIRACRLEADVSLRQSAMRAVVRGGVESNPEFCLEVIKKHNLGHSSTVSFFEAWSERDAAAATRGAMRLDEGVNRFHALNISSKKWAQTDPEAVFEWVQDVRDQLSDDELNKVEKYAITGVASRFPKKALGLLENLQPTDDRFVIDEILDAVISSNAEEAASWLKEDLSRANLFLSSRRGLMFKLARAVPESFIEIAKLDENVAGAALSSAFANLAATDIELAKEKLSQWREDLVEGTNDDEAEIVRQHRLDRHDSLTSAAIKGLASRDREKALALASEIDLNSMSGAGARSILRLIAEENPAEAAQRFASLDLDPGSHEYNRSFQAIVIEWAKVDPKAVAHWVESRPDSLTKVLAQSLIASEWVKRDPKAGSEWIAGLPSGQGKGSAIARMVTVIERDDPTRAVEWAKTISDEHGRNRYLESAFRSWLRVDPQSATESIRNSTLPEKIKWELIGE